MPSPCDQNELDESTKAEVLKNIENFNVNPSYEVISCQAKEEIASLWLEQNKVAIAVYNQSVDNEVVFGDEIRLF